MLNRIHTDESVQVLVFVVLPLLCLFVVGIILWFRSRPATTARFPTFSVSISRVSHEDAYIVYKDQEWQVDFYAGPCDRKKACLLAPRELSEENLRKLVPNLDVGLRKLGFKEYEIGKESGTLKSSSVRRIDQSRPGSW
jgi:hypothetical protein